MPAENDINVARHVSDNTQLWQHRCGYIYSGISDKKSNLKLETVEM